ncbi:hypothetical protein [Allonocardiopsis opalescens]|uniref:hypothetical protein n=1 Tax=Allonocardiopsis opalescens TaxID=1144618 RepID=UPI001FEC9AA0|nr:hypothetical protein [Allonocardiopsis opalescens]
MAIVVVLLAALAGGGYWLARELGVPLVSAACLVQVDGEPVGIDREHAMRATTAAVTGDDPGEGVDPAVVRALREGAPDGPGPVLTCRATAPEGLAAEEMTETGLTPRAQTVLDEMNEVFGELSVGGYEPGGISSGHGDDSAHYDGRAIDVFYRPISTEGRREGWLMSQWLVAHAERLALAVVIFDDRIWSTQFSAAGWRPYSITPTGDEAVDEILRHIDHVHVDVIEQS